MSLTPPKFPKKALRGKADPKIKHVRRDQKLTIPKELKPMKAQSFAPPRRRKAKP